MSLTRRDFLTAAAAALGGGLLSCSSPLRKLSDDPFRLGVASGDPSPDGFVLWTRLAPEPLAPAGGMPSSDVVVTWRIAEDEALSKVVRAGEAAARPDLGHSVHVEVEGLQPDRPYWYQFRVGDAASATGRARTAPLAGAAPGRVRIGLASCNHFEHGHFTAFDHMVREDFDIVIHVGD